MSLDEETERLLLEQLAQLQRSYTEQSMPIIERIAKIRAARPPQPMIYLADLTPEDLERMKQTVLRMQP